MVLGKKKSDHNNHPSRYQIPIMSFARKEIPIFANKNESRPNSNSSSFRTDSAISATRNLGERPLQRWVSDTPSEVDGSLETPRNKPMEAWDQFAENKRLFGLTTDYNENLYTTAIDRNHPNYKQRIAEADKKAREIENSLTTNPHVAEERILNNIDEPGNGTDEEEKYSGVQRQQTLSSLSGASGKKYLPPGRRAVSTLSSSTGSSVDPAIISSQIARQDKPSCEKANPSVPIIPHKLAKISTVVPPISDANKNSKIDIKPHVSPISAKIGAQNRITTESTHPNATATVERDVASAFKNFASQQRKNVDQIRMTRAKNDKEVKLNDLKAFATSFKLHTPVPSDLVSIIAKDPKKQREIQAKARRNVEEAEASKANSIEVPKAVLTAEAQVSNKPLPSSSQAPLSNPPSRQNVGRNHQVTNRAVSQQPFAMQQNRTLLGNRMKDLDHDRQGLVSKTPTPNLDNRVASGSTNNTEINRFSKSSSSLGIRLNPNSSEFRPSPHAASFNPSSISSPKSAATSTAQGPVSRSVLRRTPVAKEERLQVTGHFDILQHIKTMTPPPGKELAWKATGDIKPAYDTQPVWKQATSDDKSDSPIRLSYTKIFDSVPFTSQTLSPFNPSRAFAQVPHQHQLPIHLQNGAQNMSSRQSPRQSPMGLHGIPHSMTPAFNGAHDDHRMMASHSAQSFTSPRFQGAPVGYLSPLNQSNQLAYNPQMMQFANAPQMQPGHRSLSNSQFLPQQNSLGPMMMPNPSGTFIATQTIAHSPQMMFQNNQPPPFVPTTNDQLPPVPGMNGYPSPGRSPHTASHISQQGHQQPIYGINPGLNHCLNYGNPIFSPQVPPPVPIPMRPYSGASNHPSTNTPQQPHHYGPQNRRSHQTNGSYTTNKNFHHVQPQINTSNTQSSSSTIRAPDVSEEAE